MKHFQTADYEIPPGKSDIHVSLQNAMPDDKYTLYLQMINVKDANPQLHAPTVVSKSSTGFNFELASPTDSPNYHIAFIAFYAEDADWHTPIIGGEKAPCAHKWKRYNGFMDSYDYCEHCDEKKK